MISGRMSWRITLLRPVKTRDSMGGSKSSYQVAGKVWAEFRNPNAKELTAVGTLISDLVRLISIRRHREVRRGWQVQHDSRVFDVQHTYDIDREITMLVCREVVS